MEILNIISSITTPSISFNPNTGIINIKGRSIPENAVGYYSPLLALLDEYSAQPVKETVLNIQLEYINTASTRVILDLLKKAEALHVSGATSVVINWYYEEDDPDLLETGEDYIEYIKIPFNLIAIKSD